MNSNRENGFYWLSFIKEEKWTIGQFCKEFNTWQLIGDYNDISTCDIEQYFYIGDKIEK